MANETGDMKLLGNFRKLIDRVKNESNYQPSNRALTVAAMEVRYGAGFAVVQELATHIGAHKVIVSERETDFDDLKPTLTRVHNLVKASGADQSVIEDVRDPGIWRSTLWRLFGQSPSGAGTRT